MTTLAGPALTRTVLLATDNKNSVMAEVAEDACTSIAYCAYGEQSAQHSAVTHLGFNGQIREAKIGWYLLGNGYRAYNPRLMRFHSPDSWSPYGRGGLNAYMYCAGDPVNRSDPTGHFFNFFKRLGPGTSRPVNLNNMDLSGAMSMLGQAANQRITAVTPLARSGGLGEALYRIGTSNAMPGGSPARSDIGPTTTRHHSGYAAVVGMTSRPNRSIPKVSSAGGGRQNTHNFELSRGYESPPTYGEAMRLSNTDTFAESQRGQSFVVNRMSRSGGQYDRLNPPPMEHRIPLQQARPARSPSPSPPPSRDSTPPRSRNNSGGGNGAANFDDLATRLRFARRE